MRSTTTWHVLDSRSLADKISPKQEWMIVQAKIRGLRSKASLLT